MKNIFEDTKTTADANAHINPRAFEADTSNEHASMTPKVKGNREMYVFGEYLTPNSIAYAATVNNGESACERQDTFNKGEIENSRL